MLKTGRHECIQICVLGDACVHVICPQSGVNIDIKVMLTGIIFSNCCLMHA